MAAGRYTRPNRSSVSSNAKAAPASVAAPGFATKAGIKPPQIGAGLAGPQARVTKANTRDYGKAAPAAPMGPTSPNPFGNSGGGQLGGI